MYSYIYFSNKSKTKQIKITLNENPEDIKKYYIEKPDYVARSMVRNAIPFVGTLAVAKGGGPGRATLAAEDAASYAGQFIGGAAGAPFGPIGVAGGATLGKMISAGAIAYTAGKARKKQFGITKEHQKQAAKQKKLAKKQLKIKK
jgi:hypothetical protein